MCLFETMKIFSVTLAHSYRNSDGHHARNASRGLGRKAFVRNASLEEVNVTILCKILPFGAFFGYFLQLWAKVFRQLAKEKGSLWPLLKLSKFDFF